MRPGYQEQILYILNKHHSIVTVELGDAVTDDILQLIDSAKREGAIEELKKLPSNRHESSSYCNAEFFIDSEDRWKRIAQLEQSEESI